MKDLTAIIISFLRPKYTIDCIKSLRKEYPDIKILVGENGERNVDIANLVSEVGGRYIQLPFDYGVGPARNRLLSEVETKYVLIGDDDFFYDRDAKVDKMLKFLKYHKEYDVAGGRILQEDLIRNYQGHFDIQKDRIIYNLVDENEVVEIDKASGLRYKKVDIVFNFFVARVKDIIDLPWDKNIKVAYEHSHWFISAYRAGKNIAFLPDAVVKHKFQNYPACNRYCKFRNRRSDKEYFLKSLGIKYVRGFNNSVIEFDKDADKKYSAKKLVNIKSRNYVNRLTAIVISFLRPEYTIDCVRSLKETYPHIGKILVGENGRYNKDVESAVFDVGGEYIELKFDSGVPVCRNRLMDKVNSEYVLIGDDDFLYDDKAMVDRMVKFLDNHPEFDLVGGRIMENNKLRNYQGFIDINPDHLEYRIVHENIVKDFDKKSGLRFKKVDLTFNFFVARTESIRDVPWDENIKVAYEHSHWFISIKKAGKNVAFSPDPIVDHKKQKYDVSKEYQQYRARKSDKTYFFKSLGIKYLKEMNGGVTRIDEDGDKKYFAKSAVKILGRRYGSGDIIIMEQEVYSRLPLGIRERIRKS